MSELPNNTIFSDNDGTNPYAPDNDNQFYLPLDILGTATDVHGQILGKYLDQLFDYVRFPDDGSNGIITESDGSLVFSTALQELFIEAFVYNSIQEQIDLYQQCVDDTSTQVNTDRDGQSDLGVCEGGKFIYFCENIMCSSTINENGLCSHISTFLPTTRL